MERVVQGVEVYEGNVVAGGGAHGVPGGAPGRPAAPAPGRPAPAARRAGPTRGTSARTSSLPTPAPSCASL